MSTTRTYYVGQDLSKIKRLDNLMGAWIDISISIPGQSLGFFDVKTDPINPDQVYVVGLAATSNGAYGIYRSSNAGGVWSFPTGNYQAATTANQLQWYQISSPVSNICYAVGLQGYVAVSVDGGLSFNITNGFPTPTGAPETGSSKAVHFITSQIGVACFQGSIFKTVDGGSSWSYLNGGAPVTSPKVISIFLGIHMSADQQTIVALGREAIYRSTDAGATFQLVYDFTNTEGYHLTWLDDSTMWATGFHEVRLKSTDAGATWTVLSPYNPTSSQNCLAAHFYSANNGFFSFSQFMERTTNSGLTGTLTDSILATISAVWTLVPAPVCYLLHDCADQAPDIIVGDDLSAYVGKVVKLATGPSICYEVSIARECINPVSVSISQSFDSCILCSPPPPVCYLLTDCKGVLLPIVVSNDLSQYVGQTIQFSGSDTCWIVALGTDCSCEETIPGTITAFKDCSVCPPPPPYQPTKPFIEPGYSPGKCNPEIVIEANCNFSDEIYKKVLSLRFGINVCCETDVEKAFMQWEIVRLQLLQDKSLCVPCFTTPNKTCPQKPCDFC